MNLSIPAWLLWMIGGYIVGRTIEALCKLIAYLDRETRGPFPAKDTNENK